jgi:hypothetical protein
MKTESFTDSKITIEDLSSDEQLNKALRAFERNGNETSLKDLASSEIIFLLKTLPAKKADGTYERNRFGVIESAKFEAVWNRLARGLEGSLDIKQMYSKLQLEAEKTPSA